MEIDPICGMKIDPEVSVGESEYEGTTYYFCSTNCKNKFDADPGQYVTD